MISVRKNCNVKFEQSFKISINLLFKETTFFLFIVNEDDYPGEDVYVRKFIGYKIDFVMIYVIQSTNY